MPLAAEAYLVESKTVMPHLDEMRRVSKSGRYCVEETDLSSLFPVLAQPALRGCRLVQAEQPQTSVSHVLSCPGANGAVGTARLRATPTGWRGSLEVKMGGKNMTFSQYVDAKRVGQC